MKTIPLAAERIRSMKKWLISGALAILLGGAIAAPVAAKDVVRGVPSAVQTGIGNEVQAQILGELAERQERIRQAIAGAAKGRKPGRKGTRSAETVAFRKIVAENVSREIDAEKQAAELAELRAANEAAVANVEATARLQPIMGKTRVSAAISPAVAASLSAALKNLKKKVFKAPFPTQLEWDHLSPSGASASLATAASSSGSFSTSIIFQATGEAATEADPGVEFTLPEGVTRFRATATIELEDTAGYASPNGNYVYALTGVELRVMSLDVAVDGDETKYLVEALGDDPNQTTSQTIGAQTITLYGPEILASPGATYYAFAGGWANVIGNGNAIALVNGKVKDITIHYLD